jgi:hypothetical protein
MVPTSMVATSVSMRLRSDVVAADAEVEITVKVVTDATTTTGAAAATVGVEETPVVVVATMVGAATGKPPSEDYLPGSVPL